MASPFALKFNHTSAGLTAFYVAAGAAVLAVSLITNYQYGTRRGWNVPVGAQAHTA